MSKEKPIHGTYAFKEELFKGYKKLLDNYIRVRQ